MNPDVVAAETARPKHYICYRTDVCPEIDGRAAEPIWSRAPWSEAFVDIEGAAKPQPRLRTRMRMLHDAEHLFIHAELEEPHVWATITRRNAVIFRDNDFEVFIDPDGDNHNYYELEVNALGTTWELSLPRPYRCGGTPIDPDPIAGLRTAVCVDGAINDPSVVDRGWSVTIAIPFEGLDRFTARPQACPPLDGDVWRMNFSRVQWPCEIAVGAYRKIEGSREDNWVWSPQGVIDMHRPATWGFVQFSDIIAGEGTAATRSDPTLQARNALMGAWERWRLRASATCENDKPTMNTDDPAIRISGEDESWRASTSADAPGGPLTLIVDHAARLVVHRGEAGLESTAGA